MLDFSPAAMPLGTDPGSRLVFWRALEPTPTPDGISIRAVMVTSIDGTATIDGASAGLGTPADNSLFHLMRDRADAILVGARTAITEDYGPHTVTDANAALRNRPAPPVILLARSGIRQAVDHCARRGPDGMAVATWHAAPELVDYARTLGVRLYRGDQGSTAQDSGDQGSTDQPNTSPLRRLLASIGAREVACEGGPHLLTALFADDDVDEMLWSISPSVIFDRDTTRLAAAAGQASASMRVHSVFTAPDGGLYTRWLTARDEVRA